MSAHTTFELVQANLSGKIMGELGKLRAGEYRTVNDLAERFIEIAGRNPHNLSKEDRAEIIQLVSGRLSQMYSKHKIKRSSQRIGRSFGYAPKVTMGVSPMLSPEDVKNAQALLDDAVFDAVSAKKHMLQLAERMSSFQISELMAEFAIMLHGKVEQVMDQRDDARKELDEVKKGLQELTGNLTSNN